MEFINQYQEIIILAIVFIYEIIARKVPTEKSQSILTIIDNVVSIILKDKAIQDQKGRKYNLTREFKKVAIRKPAN